MEGINLLLDIANDFADCEVVGPKLVFDALPLPHFSCSSRLNTMNEVDVQSVQLTEEALKLKKKRIKRLFKTDVYLQYPKVLLNVLNSFNTDLLANFFEYQTTVNFEFTQTIQKNPFCEEPRSQNFMVTSNNKLKTFNWFCNNWTNFPDKIWTISGAKINLLKGNIIELEFDYKSYATLIFDGIDCYVHTIIPTISSKKKMVLLQETKAITICGVVKVYFDEQKLIRKIQITCSMDIN
jgi:hypothetical protein